MPSLVSPVMQAVEPIVVRPSDSALLQKQWVEATRRGNHEEAWRLCTEQAYRRSAKECDDPNLPYHQRWVWDLSDLEGRQVLVRCYHGLGDTIQFLRFVPELRRIAATVTLEIQPRLIPLLSPELADRIIPFDPACPLGAAERNVEIMELSFALRVPPSACAPPYLQVDPAKLPPGTIGLCATSGDWDNERSIPAQLLAPLCDGRPCITLDSSRSPLPVQNPLGCPFDMIETARLVAGCSLVVTVDTMIAHLAGALGVPVWVLLKHEPDWRWAPETKQSEWYPSAQLYAQPRPGDWLAVVDAVVRDLDQLFPVHRSPVDESDRMSARARLMGRTGRQDHHPADQV
ncbi:glycosyltransferase family 9 protein [Novosphingobium sp. M1R2S20]|uniref:Glycosyltransferase family 9 protein n=1 Tax=Novosphingobium rhizovicinum TaxID=3228928 RepID=A0ABV3RD08_9SPHN